MRQHSALKKAIRLRRTRYRLKSRANGRFRLSIFFSGCHTYAQLIDDSVGHTLAAVSTLKQGGSRLQTQSTDNKKSNKQPKSRRGRGNNTAAARQLGQVCGELLIKLGYTKIFLDRGSKLYHGRVAAFADAAREAGLEF